jgi:hypothetical protein
VAFFENTDFAGKQNIHPGVLIPFLDNQFTVLVFPDFAELDQFADAFGFEVLQPGNRHELLDVLNVVLKISGLDHKLPSTTCEAVLTA